MKNHEAAWRCNKCNAIEGRHFRSRIDCNAFCIFNFQLQNFSESFLRIFFSEKPCREIATRYKFSSF